MALPTGDPAGVGPLVRALGVCGGAPDLASLVLSGVGRKAMEDVVAIYAAGGLTRLRSLSFRQPRPSGPYPAASFRAMGGTHHRGVSLAYFYLIFDMGEAIDEEEDWTVAEIAGAFEWHFGNAEGQGIFPHAEMISIAI